MINAIPRFGGAWLGFCLLVIMGALLAFIQISGAAQSGRTRNTNTPSKEPAKPRATPILTRDPSSASRDSQGKPVSTPSSEGGTRSAGTRSQTGEQVSRGGPEEVSEDEVLRIRSNLVPLPAFVTDAKGRAITDLQLKDFELEVDGKARALAEISRSETPFTMVMLFDNSASLRTSSAREFEKQAAIGFFKNVMRPIDRAAIVSIWTVPELAQPLTSDVNSLVRTIETFITPDGATSLFDSIVYSAEYLRQHRGRKILVIVSDGTDTSSAYDFDDTLAKVLGLNCQVYSVRTGHSDNANLRDLAGERRLQEFAAQTGGSVYSPRDRVELREAFAKIAIDLSHQYVLSYYPSDDVTDGRFHPITLRVNTRPGLQVRTRKGYYSPKD